MPSRKRKAATEPDVEEAPRRATRSSTRLKESGESKAANTPAKAPKESKATKKRKVTDETESNSTKKKPKSTKEKTKATTPTTTPKSQDLPANVTTLTIPSPDLKSPLQCHVYTPTPSSSPSTPKSLIFTHGAGGTLLAPAVTHFCTGYSPFGKIVAFQGSMNLKARVKGFGVCAGYEEEQGRKVGNLVFGGRSMGARAAVMGVSEILDAQTQAAGDQDKSEAIKEMMLVLVSYPLIGPKDVRDQILLSLPSHTKVLFVIGSKDSMCPLDKLHTVRRKMAAKTQVLVVRGADHGMHLGGGKERVKGVGIETGRRVGEWVAGRAEMGDVSFVGGEEEEE